MHNAIEDLYILYIEETLSISAVYTVLSSRPQSFLLSIYALCTIPQVHSPHGQGWYCPGNHHASCQQGFSRAESLPPKEAPAPVPWMDGGTLARRRDRPRSDGGMAPWAGWRRGVDSGTLGQLADANCARRS